MLGDVVEKLTFDPERPACQRDLDLAVFADVFDAILEHAGDMGGIGRRGDGDDRLGVRNLPGSCQDRGAAEAMADQDRRRLARFPQVIGGAHEIGDVGREGGIREIAFAGAEAGEVEP